jgi:hypothetical protein
MAKIRLRKLRIVNEETMNIERDKMPNCAQSQSMLEAIVLFVTFALPNQYLTANCRDWSRSSVDRIEVS